MSLSSFTYASDRQKEITNSFLSPVPEEASDPVFVLSQSGNGVDTRAVVVLNLLRERFRRSGGGGRPNPLLSLYRHGHPYDLGLFGHIDIS